MPVHYSEDSEGPSTRRAAGGDSVPSYENLTKAELQDELELRGLPKTGSKDELIARLRDAG